MKSTERETLETQLRRERLTREQAEKRVTELLAALNSAEDDVRKLKADREAERQAIALRLAKVREGLEALDKVLEDIERGAIAHFHEGGP